MQGAWSQPMAPGHGMQPSAQGGLYGVPGRPPDASQVGPGLGSQRWLAARQQVAGDMRAYCRSVLP